MKYNQFNTKRVLVFFYIWIYLSGFTQEKGTNLVTPDVRKIQTQELRNHIKKSMDSLKYPELSNTLKNNIDYINKVVC